MSKYRVTIGIELSDQDDPVEVQREVLDDLNNELNGDIKVDPPDRHLGTATDAALTIGTVLASNPEYTRTILRTVIDHPVLDVISISSGGNRELFTVDIDIDLSVFDGEVTIFDQYKGTTVYESAEIPKEIQQRELLEKINEATGEEYSYEEFFEDRDF